MKNSYYKTRVYNEMYENVVAATGTQEQLERVEKARSGGEEKIMFYQGRPVKRCYPYNWN